MLFCCDLYAQLRSKLIKTICKNYYIVNCSDFLKSFFDLSTTNQSNLSFYLFNKQTHCRDFLVSNLENTHSHTDIAHDSYISHPRDPTHSPTKRHTLNHTHSPTPDDELEITNISFYLQNAIGTFIGRCFEKFGNL